jgi:hypothetical protein
MICSYLRHRMSNPNEQEVLSQAAGRPDHAVWRPECVRRARREKLQEIIDSKPRSLRNDLLPAMDLQATAISELKIPKHTVRMLDPRRGSQRRDCPEVVARVVANAADPDGYTDDDCCSRCHTCDPVP